MSNQPTFTEAPASATARMTSPQGVEWLLTCRDAGVAGLLKKIDIMQAHLLKNGWTPGNGRNGNGAAAAGEAAPTCQYHGPMKRSKKFTGWFCPSKMGDGSYCQEKIED